MLRRVNKISSEIITTAASDPLVHHKSQSLELMIMIAHQGEANEVLAFGKCGRYNAQSSYY